MVRPEVASCEAVHGMLFARVQEGADRVEGVEYCRLLGRRACHQHSSGRRRCSTVAERLTAVEIPPNGFGHRRKRTPTMPVTQQQ